MNPPAPALLLDVCLTLPEAARAATQHHVEPLLLHGAWATVSLALFALWLWGRARAQHLAREHARTVRSLGLAAQRAKGSQVAGLEGAKQAQKSAEIALAAQKKKNYQLGEELRAAQLASQDALLRAQQAIDDAQRARAKAEAAQSAAHGRAPSRAQQATPRPQPTSLSHEPQDAGNIEAARGSDKPHEPSPPGADTLGATQSQLELAALKEALGQLEADKTLREASFASLAQELKEARREVGRKNKRIEDLRRLDLMSKGKIEVLEDKVKRLGRELYESISLLAQLKGEVGAVPGPKAKPRAPGRTQEAAIVPEGPQPTPAAKATNGHTHTQATPALAPQSATPLS